MATSIVFLGLGVGCSKDEIVGNATAEAVEDGLNGLLTTTVDPLFSFFGVVADLAAGGAARTSPAGGITCPDMNTVCAGGGSGTCTPSGGGLSLTFDFNQCVVVSGDAPVTLTGGLIVTPGAPITLSLNGLVIDGSPAMTGTGSVNVGTCSYVASVSTTDPASLVGTVFQCPADDYPTAQSSLTLSFDDVQIVVTFNGSSVASAAATKSGALVANCSINLAANPPSSSCDAP